MALNKYMHPRNIYKERKPNFKELASKYEEFLKCVTFDDHGKVQIDFKKPECLRALSWALLKDDFDLDVLMPLDRLIPTIPLRLNYILWLEDILNGHAENIKGIDIGTGASCVYPLLGAKKNGWNFLATESDGTNYQYAKKNVENNQMTEKIHVLHVPEGSTLHDILSENSECYDFCMCNPPFYGSNFEAWGMLTSRSDHRPEPCSVSTASPVESIVLGGEVQFVKQMINDSILLKERIRVYTTMLGKKSSISILKEELKRNRVDNISTTEFCQGKTMRWGLGWSFDASVTFPKPPSKTMKAQKPRPPLVFHIPKLDLYTLDNITEQMLSIFLELQISVTGMKKSKNQVTFSISAKVNTWSHQRRKRRQQNALSDSSPQSKSSDSGTEVIFDTNNRSPTNALQQLESGIDPDLDPDLCSKKLKTGAEEKSVEVVHQPQESVKCNATVNELSIKQCSIEHTTGTDTEELLNSNNKALNGDKSFSSNSGTHDMNNSIINNSGSKPPSSNVEQQKGKPSCESVLFSAMVTLAKKAEDDIVMELLWLAGESREAMHQVLQYIKNKLH